MAKLSKTAKASGATGKTKASGPKRNKPKAQAWHRARKGPRCPDCGRRQRVKKPKRISHKQSINRGERETAAWPCQFQGGA